jgi:3-phenylpropionate/cinnamic acid dioxygenase small subunit
MSTSTLSGDLLEAAGSLQRAYVHTLDSLDIQAWPGYFASDPAYAVTTRENVERGLDLALVLDDSRERIHDRVVYITKVWDGHYNQYWPRHVMGPPFVIGGDGEELELETPLAVYITEPGEIGSRLLAVGVYRDVVTLQDGEAKFRSRQVVLDTSVLPRYFVYPL